MGFFNTMVQTILNLFCLVPSSNDLYHSCIPIDVMKPNWLNKNEYLYIALECRHEDLGIALWQQISLYHNPIIAALTISHA